MYFKDGNLRLSPSDLTQLMRSRFASYSDCKAAEFPEAKALRNEDDAMMKSLLIRGYAHEVSNWISDNPLFGVINYPPRLGKSCLEHRLAHHKVGNADIQIFSLVEEFFSTTQ